MSYTTVKDGIALRLKGLGLAESQTVDYKDSPSNEYNNTFIIKSLSGVMDEAESETLIDRFYDVQEWQVQVAFAKSAQNDIVNLDELNRKKDAILKDIDKPANWSSFVRILKYKNWVVTEQPNYFLLTINLKVVDIYIY